MALKPYYQIAGLPARPQFLLKDRQGREYGVVEHYETDRSKPDGYALLEFFSPDPGLKGRPLVWLDLTAWTVVPGRGKHLPDDDFEAGLDGYLQGFPDSERDLRRERARQARFADLVALAGQGYTIAYQEMFPGELKREDFPVVEAGGRAYLVDDQYGIQPGDFRNQVTLVFMDQGPAGASAARSAGASAARSAAASAATGPAAPAPQAAAALLVNWQFGSGYEIVQASLDEDLCHRCVQALVGNKEAEKIYKERLLKMRREGTLLGVKPKPYAPATPQAAEAAPAPIAPPAP
jgi:hypothetical protein